MSTATRRAPAVLLEESWTKETTLEATFRPALEIDGRRVDRVSVIVTTSDGETMSAHVLVYGRATGGRRGRHYGEPMAEAALGMYVAERMKRPDVSAEIGGAYLKHYGTSEQLHAQLSLELARLRGVIATQCRTAETEAEATHHAAG